jgi:hypothetical protein
MLREEYPDLEILPSSLEVERIPTLELRTNMYYDGHAIV